MSGIVIISFFLSVHVLIDQQNPCYLVLLPAMHIKLSPTYHMAQKNGLLVCLIYDSGFLAILVYPQRGVIFSFSTYLEIWRHLWMLPKK